MNIDWILTDPIRAAKVGEAYVITETRGVGRECIISFAGDRMLFDGQDIDTEDFMAYVALCEAIDGGMTEFAAES